MQSKLGKAAAWALFGSGAQYIAVFGLLVYLAHVLQPRDFGLMATVTIGLDLGLRAARWGQVELLQQPQYRNDDARNQSLRLSLAIACLCSLAFVMAAKPLGRAYHSEQLTSMMFICAPIFPFNALSVVPEAILRSEFRFRLFAFRSTMTTVVGAAVAISLVSLGLGPLALAVQRLVQTSFAGVWVWTAVAWRPRLGGARNWSRILVRDGASIVAGTVLPLLVPRSVDLFVGINLGAAQLGLLRIAFRINDFVAQMVIMPLVSVANTQLASVSGDLAAMRRSYLQLTQATAAVMCPVLIGLALVAPEAIPIIFGAKWREAVPLVQIIGLLALVMPVNYYFMPTMVALGHSRLVLRQAVFQLVLGLILTVVAAQYSLIAVVAANVFRGALVAAYNVFDLRRHMRLRIGELARYMAPPYVATFVMAAAVIVVRTALHGTLAPLATLAVLGAVGAGGYGATIWLGGRAGLWPDYATLLVRRMAPPRPAASAG